MRNLSANLYIRNMNKAPLENIKVVELGSVLAVPLVGSFLAELGADVVKIEPPAGDITKKWKLPQENTEISAYYKSANHGKKILYKDLRTPGDLQEIKDLIKNSDIVLTNILPKKLKELTLDYESVLFPELIYAHLTGYGTNSNRPGFDAVIQAEAGFMFLNRENPEAIPTKMPVALMDILAAHQLKEAVLLALYNREKTKKGGYLHVSLMKSAITSLANQAYAYLVAGINPEPLGSGHPSIVPYGNVYKTKDNKWIQLGVGTDKQFENLCKVLETDLHQNPKFKTNPERVKNRKELNEILQKLISKFNRDELIDKLLQANVPCAKINDVAEALQTPQAKEIMMNEGKALRQSAFDLDFYEFPEKL